MKIENSKFVFLLMAVFAVVSMSCSKFLDVPPQNKLTLPEFWRAKNQAVAAIGGVYSNLGSTKLITGGSSATSLSPVESYIYWGEIRGELLKSNPGKLTTDQISKENVDNFIVNPTDVTTKYTQFYRIINEANQAIKHIPEIKSKDPVFSQTDEDNLTGEAYFLRAFAYFWLVRTFKEVPLILEPSETDNQNYSRPKTPTDSIFFQIVTDLERARRTLPEWYTNNLYAHCRATKYTAETVLADVYLWMAALSSSATLKNGYYQKAIDNCDSVINSGRYFMIHGSTLNTVFSSSGTTESIFETYSNSTLNSQTNSLYDWFTSSQYIVVTTQLPLLFSEPTRDYRGATVPAGPTPPKGTAFSYNASTMLLLKFNKSTRDAIWNFYRYPEVLLMKAEALSHLYVNDPVQIGIAVDLVNEVRARAYGKTPYPKLLTASTQEMDKFILEERGREFVGEGKRWFDLVRFASRDNFEHPEILIDRIVQSYSGITQTIIRPRINDPDGWYLPLNAEALSSNPSLVQNPYYE